MLVRFRSSKSIAAPKCVPAFSTIKLSLVAKSKFSVVAQKGYFSQEKDETGFHDDFKTIRKKYEEKGSTTGNGDNKQQMKDQIQKANSHRDLQ